MAAPQPLADATSPAPSQKLAPPARPGLRTRALRSAAARLLPRNVLLLHGARDPSRRRVALTFDDGPDSTTPAYLACLSALGARATFFFVGRHAARLPAHVSECARRGHEIGGHGWSHEGFPTMSPTALLDELSRTAAALPCARRRLVRPPRGAVSARVLTLAALSGYTTVLWSLDSNDCRDADPSALARRVTGGRLRPGDVVLLHEGQPWTLQALPGIVSALRQDGWELVTAGELVE